MNRLRSTVAALVAVALLWAGAGWAQAKDAPAGSPAAPAVAAIPAASGSPTVAVGGAAGLSADQRKARAGAIKRCRRIGTQVRRQRCLKRVRTRYRRIARRQGGQVPGAPAAPTAVHEVLVTDNTSNPIQSSYFIPFTDIRMLDGVIQEPAVPTHLEIRTGEAVRFVWDEKNRDSPHTIAPFSFPAGVNRLDFSFLASAALGVTFQRTFTVPGRYVFVCSLHQETQILELTVTR